MVDGSFAPGSFRDKIVVVGASAPSLQDLHPTSTTAEDPMPGPEIHANAIETALRGFPLRSGPAWLDVLLILLAGLAAPALAMRVSALRAVLGAGALAAVLAVLAQLLFDRGTIVSVVYAGEVDEIDPGCGVQLGFMPDSPFFRAVETSVRTAGLPYGYAITVWCTGAALIGEHGKASPAAIFLFAGGAATGYGLLKALTASTHSAAETPLAQSPHPVRAGFLHVCAIGLAIATALAIAQVPGDAPWFLAPLLATLVYLSGSSAEVALVEDGGDVS